MTDPIPLSEIEAARERLYGIALRTPLVPLNVPAAPARLLLKLENLQPIGAFKIRGAGNAMAIHEAEILERGVWTASAGNMAQGVAWNARRLGVSCSCVVPDHAPDAKLQALERLGAEIHKVTFPEWWEIIVSHGHPGMEGVFIHPVSDRAVMAGNGTIGLELLEDEPELDAIVIPYGGGGLSSGIASAVTALRPEIKIYAAEVETAAPLAAAFEAGEPTDVEYVPSFVDGIGSSRVLDEMWPLVSTLLDGSLVVSIDEIESAVRHLARHNRVVAEGAGAAGVAAALSGAAGTGTVACIVSGGNIDLGKLAAIFQSS